MSLQFIFNLHEALLSSWRFNEPPQFQGGRNDPTNKERERDGQRGDRQRLQNISIMIGEHKQLVAVRKTHEWSEYQQQTCAAMASTSMKLNLTKSVVRELERKCGPRSH
jgi:hypothetical protein